MLEVLSIIVEQKDRAEDAGELGFNEAHEMFEHIGQGGAQGNHLQDMGLAFAQAILALALGNVAGNADKTEDFIVVIAQGHLG